MCDRFAFYKWIALFDCQINLVLIHFIQHGSKSPTFTNFYLLQPSSFNSQTVRTRYPLTLNVNLKIVQTQNWMSEKGKKSFKIII